MGYRKRGDSYEVNVAFKGSRLFATVASEEEARMKVVELKAQLIQEHRKKMGQPEQAAPAPIPQVATSWTLKSAIAKAFEVRWDGTRSERFYKEQCTRLVEEFGEDARLDTLKTDSIDAFKRKMAKAELAPSTMNHRLSTLSVIFKVAQERGGVNHRPSFGIKKRTRGRVRWLSETEEVQMLALLTQRGLQDMHDWTVVMVDTGMRPSETKHMTGQWLDFRTSNIHVLDSKTEAGKRAIPMTKRVKAILERRVLTYPKGSLFPIAWRNYQRAWDTSAAAMGLADEPDFVPYCCRHTFGTRLIQRGEKVEVIAKLMGHTDVNQTLVYAKLGASQFAAAIARLEPVPAVV
jgi:integrase